MSILYFFFFTYKYYFPFFSAPSNIPAVRLVYTATTAATTTTRKYDMY